MLTIEESCRAKSLEGQRVLIVQVSQLFKSLREEKKAVYILILPSCLPATIFSLGISIKNSFTLLLLLNTYVIKRGSKIKGVSISDGLIPQLMVSFGGDHDSGSVVCMRLYTLYKKLLVV